MQIGQSYQRKLHHQGFVRPSTGICTRETKNYVKDEFIVSVVDDQRYDTLTLYTDLDKASVLSRTEIKLDKDYFFKISYNEKIKPFTIDDIKFEFEKTKVYWLNWCF